MSGLVSSRSHISGRRSGSSTSSSIIRPTCTLRTPVKPSAGRARSTAWPWGSRIPALGLTSTRARIALRGARAGQPGVELLAADALVGLDVLLAGARDHVVGDRRRRRVAIPARPRRPVAYELLVEAGLAAAGLVAVGRPETRGVRRADLVADRQPAVGVQTELELGVGEDDPVGASVVGGVLIERQRDVADALGQLAIADQLDGSLEVDRLVVADLGLGAWGEQRLGQAV